MRVRDARVGGNKRQGDKMMIWPEPRVTLPFKEIDELPEETPREELPPTAEELLIRAMLSRPEKWFLLEGPVSINWVRKVFKAIVQSDHTLCAEMRKGNWYTRVVPRSKHEKEIERLQNCTLTR